MRVQDLRPLVRRYGGRGPRYTSYPTAAQFSSLSETVAREHLRRAAQRTYAPWSIYVHVPFCEQRCRFCACAVVATPHRDRVAPPYLHDLLAEVDLVRPLLGERTRVAQLHLGGGTPTYLTPSQLDALYQGLRQRFDRTEDFESSIEADPRVTTPAHLDVMAAHGVERISLGVQDFEPRVGHLIGRLQSLAMTRATVQQARARGIAQVNLDLVYGLPGQTTESLERTAAQVVALSPDRLALYGYAHVPWMRGNQRAIDPATLPDADARLEMFLAARERFEAAGYVSIGLDHFARPDDPLAQAHAAGTLHRNFMGYTTRARVGGTDDDAATDLLGFGVTAIGDVAGALVQNETKLARWAQAVRAGRLPVARGIVRDREDALRGRIIADLMCRGRVHREEIERAFAVQFDAHFARALGALAPMQADGLLVDDGQSITLTELGRSFVRNVAMSFDGYLGGGAGRHSATV